eukprot:Phypoly_transcript_09027.p1 GENE.Phypoly_transcript_09027~~Phypoly_transcript_09027.p1  ORF type:complete len:464 (+),score=107.34 Phypoly_transcript_09027:191-1393(+)
MAINSDPSLNVQEKAKRIQMLMTPNARAPPTPKEESTPEKELQPTFYKNDAEKGVFGCKHYIRACKLKAACCGHFFPCRLCHDEGSDHPINRFDTQEILCMRCKTIQPVSDTCSNCKESFARYFCAICKFFDDDPNKKIFHCADCGICRVGPKEDFRHCSKCRACLAKAGFENHTCIENKFDSNCPICHQNLFTSTLGITTMQCGHGIHEKCYYAWTRNNFKCPICAKSIAKPELMQGWWSAYDMAIHRQPMPIELNGRVVHISCNDCATKTWLPMHFLGNKCGNCGGYATSIITTKNMDPSDPVTLSTNHKVRYATPEVLEALRAEIEAAEGAEGEGEEGEGEEGEGGEGGEEGEEGEDGEDGEEGEEDDAGEEDEEEGNEEMGESEQASNSTGDNGNP